MTPNACHACGQRLTCALPQVLDPTTGERFAVLACTRCGLGHTWPQPDALDRYYAASYYGRRHGVTDALCVRRRLRWLLQHAPSASGRLLDFGCGDGSFLSAARSRGFSTCGVEPGAAATAAAAAGHDVRDSLEHARDLAPLAAVTCFHSFEHVRDPAGTLAALHAMMAQDALLIVAVPDSGGLQARLFGRHWLHLDVPRHLFHFTAAALSLLLERTGFAIEARHHREFEYDLAGVTQSALDALLPEPRVLLSRITGRRDGGPALVASSFALAALTAPLALGITLLGGALGSGGTLVAVARRRDSPPGGEHAA